jgi:hypothetical protein
MVIGEAGATSTTTTSDGQRDTRERQHPEGLHDNAPQVLIERVLDCDV